MVIFGQGVVKFLVSLAPRLLFLHRRDIQKYMCMVTLYCRKLLAKLNIILHIIRNQEEVKRPHHERICSVPGELG